MSALNENFTLYNGVKIPKIGFGTWQIEEGAVAYGAVTAALEAGYTHIDTAYVYGNEKSVGKAIREFGPRENVFITSKIPAEIKDYRGAREHFQRSMENLQLDVIDLMLIHAPWPWAEKGKNCDGGNIEVWTALEEFYEAGKVHSIGVSNFNPREIENITAHTKVVPMVNQIRYFIGNTQAETVAHCREHQILVEGYSPLATGKIAADERLADIAKRYNATIPQICIRYLLENDILPLPKSITPQRIVDNAKVDFSLSKADMDYLDGLVLLQ